MTDDVQSTSVEPEELRAAAAEVVASVEVLEISDEERMRQEAAKQMDRRKRKMMSPEERLAKITGRPVEEVSPILDVVPSGESISTTDVPSVTVSSSTQSVDDPPLEHLTRDPFTADTPTWRGSS